jgi:FdhD protein
MAQKAIMAGVPALAGMSAPTLAAVELAEQAGMTLLAFARGSDFVCYTHPQHLSIDSAAAYQFTAPMPRDSCRV